MSSGNQHLNTLTALSGSLKARLLKAIMDSAYDGMMITDGMGRVIMINRAAQELIGCAAEDIVGCSTEELVDDGYLNESVVSEVLKRRTTVSIVQDTRAGRRILATGSPVLSEDDGIEMVIVNDRDITELTQMSRELEHSKALIDLYRQELSHQQSRKLQSDHHFCRSKEMNTVYERALRVARFGSTVLLTGESGVGKGFLARFIHQNSRRATGPFVRVDCGSIVETLFESEMFGYEKGSFTGALYAGKPGLVEVAEGGTLFLDEIGDTPISQQVKLLRFLDEKSVVRVGGSVVRKVDVRVVAATNTDLQTAVNRKLFRKDLFFRVNVAVIDIPPLRNRREDISDLVNFFMARKGKSLDVRKQIEREALDALMSYHYPGNVRELENVIESLLVMCPAPIIGLPDLPGPVRMSAEVQATGDSAKPVQPRSETRPSDLEMILGAIDKYGSQREAARHLGISQSTISRKIKKQADAAD
jgi:PAS domain S-box-containing protein